MSVILLSLEYFKQQVQITSPGYGIFLDKWLPAISIFIPLLIFAITVFLDRRKENRRKKQEITDKIFYLKILLSSSIKKSQEQHERIKDYIGKIEIDDINFKLITFIPLSDLYRLKDILSRDQYFIAFNKYYKNEFDSIKMYEKIMSNVDFLEAVFSSLLKMLEKAQENNFEIILEYKQLVNATLKLTGDFVRKNALTNSLFYKEIRENFSEFLKGLTNTRDIRYFNDRFVNPIFDLLFNELSKHNSELTEELFQILENCRNAKQFFNGIKQGNQDLASDLREINNDIYESLERLRELAPKL